MQIFKFFQFFNKYSTYLKYKVISIRSYKKFINPLAEIKEMSIDIKDIQTTRETKLKSKKSSKSSRFPPAQIYLCVVGNGSISSSRALYIFTDHERYLFNCGEGTQRYATEHKVKLSKLEHLFITHNSWENTGGLPGLSLTLQDIGIPEINIHGPPNLDRLFSLTETFANFSRMNINTIECKDETFSDNCIEVKYIPIYSESKVPDKSLNFSSSESSDEENSYEPKTKKLCIQNDLKANKFRDSYSCRPSENVCVAFACKGHSKPGRLLTEKCIEFGVPPGPLLGDLKSGKDVTLPSGKTVYSKDVVSPSEDCPLFLVVECPSSDFLHNFVNEPTFSQYQSNSPKLSHIASLIVHFTPPHVMKTPEYQEWMKKFPDSTSHLILNSDNSTLCSAAVHRIQYKLNMIHPEIFSLLHENEVSQACLESQRLNIIHANSLERYYLRPATGMDKTSSLKLDVKEYINEAFQAEGFQDSLKYFNKSISEIAPLNSNADCFPVITFLGTGSMIPSKARNVSAIIINTNEDNFMLLDCGEGTCGQLIRLYGKEYEKVLQQMSHIFISHMHADHHLGLITILKAREDLYKKLRKEPRLITIIGPYNLKLWLRRYCKYIEKQMYSYKFLDSFEMQNSEFCNINKSIKNIQISTVPVIHCNNSYGVIIKSNDPDWKVVYSGDTMPCEDLVTAGNNCTVLIHEASMEDELSEEALFKTHSTTSQAINVGKDMNSSYTILTHFSQRYAKIPLFNENFCANVGCAFDNMTVQRNQLHILPLLIPTLKCLFAEDIEELKIIGDKRRKKDKIVQYSLKEAVKV